MKARVHDHICKQFDDELRVLKDKILLMGRMVQEHLAGTMRSLSERDVRTAQKLVRSDWRVNILEMECDHQAVRMIALRQPAASDLRFLFGALKIDTDLERIGDLVVNIAERVQWLAASPLEKPDLDLGPLAATVEQLLGDTLEVFARSDAPAAQQILQRDASIDKLFASIFDTLVSDIQSDPTSIERAMRLLFIAKHLERIADHATNIAEMVVYMVHGKDVRHRWNSQQS